MSAHSSQRGWLYLDGGFRESAALHQVLLPSFSPPFQRMQTRRSGGRRQEGEDKTHVSLKEMKYELERTFLGVSFFGNRGKKVSLP